jgi:hypothetical protein
VGQTSVGLDAAAGTLLSDGVSVAYFLGLISDGTAFTTATLEPGPLAGGGYFFFNVDDVTTSPTPSVPEPSALALLALGGLALTSRVSGAAGSLSARAKV